MANCVLDHFRFICGDDNHLRDVCIGWSAVVEHARQDWIVSKQSKYHQSHSKWKAATISRQTSLSDGFFLPVFVLEVRFFKYKLSVEMIVACILCLKSTNTPKNRLRTSVMHEKVLNKDNGLRIFRQYIVNKPCCASYFNWNSFTNLLFSLCGFITSAASDFVIVI